MLAVAATGERLESICESAPFVETVTAALAALPATLRTASTRMLQEQGYPGGLSTLLCSRFGEPLRGATTRLIAAKLLKAHGSPHVWNSIDALSGVLADPGN
jgi:hypothetical protein